MKLSDKTCFTNFQKRRLSLGIFFILMLSGIIIGTIMVGTSSDVNLLNRLLFTNNLFKKKDELSIISQFFKSLTPICAILILQFFAGMFAFGQTFAVLTVIYRGTAAGISSSIIYLILGVKGSFAVLLTLFPYAAVSAFLIILGARESVRLSGKIARYSFFQAGDSTPPDIRLYSLKFAVLLVFGFLFSLADAFIAYFINPILYN